MSLGVVSGVKKGPFSPDWHATSAENDVKEEPPDDYDLETEQSLQEPGTSAVERLVCRNCGLICESQFFLKIHERQFCPKRIVAVEVLSCVEVDSSADGVSCSNCGVSCRDQYSLMQHEPRCRRNTFQEFAKKYDTRLKYQLKIPRLPPIEVREKQRPLKKPPPKRAKVMKPRFSPPPPVQKGAKRRFKCFFCPEFFISLFARKHHVEKLHPSNVTPQPTPAPADLIVLKHAGGLVTDRSPQLVSVLAAAGFALPEAEVSSETSNEAAEEDEVAYSPVPSEEAETSEYDASPALEDFSDDEVEVIEIKDDPEIIEIKDEEVAGPSSSNQNLFPCGICPETLLTADDRHLHERDHFGTRDLTISTLRCHRYRCTLCQKVMRVKKEAEYHILAHALTRSTMATYANLIAALAIHNSPKKELSLHQICHFSSKYFNCIHHNRFQFQDALGDILKDREMFTTHFVIEANEEGDLEQQAVFRINEEWRQRRFPGLLEAFEREPNKWLELPALWPVLKDGTLNWLKT